MLVFVVVVVVAAAKVKEFHVRLEEKRKHLQPHIASLQKLKAEVHDVEVVYEEKKSSFEHTRVGLER